MAGFLGTEANLSEQSSTLISASNASNIGILKRKRAGDDPLLSSDSQSESTKRQKHGTGGCETAVSSSGEDNSGPLRIEPFDHHPALNNDSISESSKPCSGSTSHQPSAQLCSVPADEAAVLETPKTPRTAPKDTMSISDRKRYFIYTPSDKIKERMRRKSCDLYKLFDDLRSMNDCWLHPCPPPARREGRPVGTIRWFFSWKDSSGNHDLGVNVGIVALIVEYHLTEEQMEGYVNKAWHLSHLCGNWTCCNWRHMTIESGRVNISRNPCFLQATHCRHDPPCMKDRKRRFNVTLAISNQIKRAIAFTGNGANPAAEAETSTITLGGYGCGICGKDVYCFGGDFRICRSLASRAKSLKALEQLESCLQPRYEVFEAIAYLKQIIADLVREKEASDAVVHQLEY